MVQSFNIAGIQLSIACEDTVFSGIFKKQLSNYSAAYETPDLTINIIRQKRISVQIFRLLMDEEIKWARMADDGICAYCVNEKNNEVYLMAETHDNWKSVTVRTAEIYRKYDTENLNIYFIIGIVFKNIVAIHNGFFIHAAAVEYNKKGILYSAPSGTGKSTQANMWLNSYKSEARIINDDTPIIRIINEEAYIFGAPWCGSSYRGVNDSVKLSAMVDLNRGETNTIRRLDRNDAITRLLPRVFIPYFSEDLSDRVIKTFEKVLIKISAYQLSCTIHPEAVELVRSCLI